ncbi:MAG: hypothetical protein OHK0040_06250 [bacterium]
MNQRILEIIDYLEKRFTDDIFSFSADVLEELLFEGYLEHEIEEAMSWIETYQSEKEQLNLFEVTGKESNVKMSPSAYNYLTNLLNQNIITENTFEEILNYCLFLADEDIDMEKILQYHMSLNILKEKWGNEARANYLAFSMKKDC